MPRSVLTCGVICGVGLVVMFITVLIQSQPKPFVEEGAMELPPIMIDPVSPGAVDEDAPEEFTTTETGLKYRIRRKSDGEKANINSTVVVHYRGWLDNGEQFDSSYHRGKPATFQVVGVVRGWIEGLQLIGEGGMIELEVPPELGYKGRGSPDGKIPPDATLHFLIEVIEVQ